MKIALFGNPNTGKSTVFNLLTGMRQQVGNFPGVTVDMKVGKLIHSSKEIEILDFPGTYSIYPRSKDEEVVYKVISDPKHKEYPDLAIVIADASNLERNLFLFSQLYDLKIPLLLVLNMTDVAARKGKITQLEELKKVFSNIEVVEMNARVGLGIDRLRKAIEEHPLLAPEENFTSNFSLLSIDDLDGQAKEAEKRYEHISAVLDMIQPKKEATTEKSLSHRIDKVLVHPILGYLIFASILFILFQFIYAFASIPMDFIDQQFTNLSAMLQNNMPKGLFFDLLSQGIVPGIGGVVVFVPQIALLFFFLSLLEASGYLSRVVFIMDKLMRPLGLNGKSVVPLLSSAACAIPGIMSARTISSWKERLTTILVAPLISCSARIPVFTLLINLVVPNKTVGGFIHLQGLTLFVLYFLGLISALLIAFILHILLKGNEKSFLLLEMPAYKIPRWKNVGIEVWEKVKLFVLEAGKIILAISVVLWALASFGPENRMSEAVQKIKHTSDFKLANAEEQDQYISSAKLQNSYMGILGRTIEPVIAPLGYDWKIGISLITSFAAREVFVGSLATIYSVHAEDENKTLLERMRNEKRSDGTKMYTLATGLSLMVFYVYAMQCMATLAIVKRETKSWKYPILQIVYMGTLAYVFSFVVYQFFR